ncbi:hypothetical protein LTR10_023678 [Elasticomyces elasticus]|uniref:Uncharacterized protein n=1 Tax=Exophiala sideris TaxID=1016849 RepID=A0ABR0IVK4_9EURO|nr:hypothetical protein LTR10_023678 [Elasticomyces elasticus]KAK5049641.1 hypothetical protein LTR69_010937 [Exophiala sideris]
MADEAQHEANIKASATALDSLTTAAADHPIPPLEHIHAGADEKKSHAWLKKILPDSVLDDYENRYHFGNYVIDRKTGQKSYEQMSVYVRLGMHFLYYGSKQEKLLHAKKVEKLLEEQSVKMGKQYDSPESKAHIKPFLDSFQLWDSMKEMVKPNPEDYAIFNEFFSREIRPEARPPAEPVTLRSSALHCHVYQSGRFAESHP